MLGANNDEEKCNLTATSFYDSHFETKKELDEYMALNMNRVDKDVARCDRNHAYFKSHEGLRKLKNVMYT